MNHFPWHLERANTGRGREDWPSVAILHSFYRSAAPSGENDTVRRQFRLLAEHGVAVSLLSVSTDELLLSPGYMRRTAWGVATGMGLSPIDVLAELRPEVVHVHNLFPNLSTGWLGDYRGAIVASLHNYRPACAAATLSRDGHDCDLCPTRSSVHAVVHSCYHGSRLATVPLAIRTRNGAKGDAILRRADVVLAPSPTMRDTYSALGVEGVDLLYQPTDAIPAERQAPDLGEHPEEWLFVGRLTEEKGISGLVRTWPSQRRLTVIGDGPLLDSLLREAGQRDTLITFAGFVSQAELDAAMCRATGLVFPSQWREGAPAVYSEALARGLPVVALLGNAVADMVAEHQTGVVIGALDARVIEEALNAVTQNRHAFATQCHEAYARHFTVSSWLHGLHGVYTMALARAAP